MTYLLSENVLETVAEHLGIEVEELGDFEIATTDDSAEAIERSWNECCFDLLHLSQEARTRVLQRSDPYKPEVIDGVAVRLYTKVQFKKGQPRKTAAIIDADKRIVFAF